MKAFEIEADIYVGVFNGPILEFSVTICSRVLVCDDCVSNLVVSCFPLASGLWKDLFAVLQQCRTPAHTTNVI